MENSSQKTTKSSRRPPKPGDYFYTRGMDTSTIRKGLQYMESFGMDPHPRFMEIVAAQNSPVFIVWELPSNRVDGYLSFNKMNCPGRRIYAAEIHEARKSFVVYAPWDYDCSKLSLTS